MGDFERTASVIDLGIPWLRTYQEQGTAQPYEGCRARSS